METLYVFDESDLELERKLIRRRQALKEAYDALPLYASPAFWGVVDSVEMPLEVLVRLLRTAIRGRDEYMRSRLIVIILRRIQGMNECWACGALKRVPLRHDERDVAVSDLCADLHERILRALIDVKRPFWEENFFCCLHFERKHVQRSFMIREGWWRNQRAQREMRIPRACVASLDQLTQRVDGSAYAFDIEDEQARIMFLAVECSDVLRFVLCLPERLKAVVLLMFWEDRSEKETARVLGVSDRTVRNRLRHALNVLREALITEKEMSGC